MLQLVSVISQPVLLSKEDSTAVTTCSASAYFQVVANVSLNAEWDSCTPQSLTLLVIKATLRIVDQALLSQSVVIIIVLPMLQIYARHTCTF